MGTISDAGNVRNVDDLQAYTEMVKRSADLERLALRVLSPRTETALLSASQALRILASAVYRSGLSEQQR